MSDPTACLRCGTAHHHRLPCPEQAIVAVNAAAAAEPRFVSTEAPVDWAAVHRTTRWAATVSTFGPRTKVVLSSPPVLLIAFWWYVGPLRVPLLAFAFGIPMAAAAAWWCGKIWVRGPAERPPVSPAVNGTPAP